MADVVVRDLDDEVIERLKARAAVQETSVERMLREMLTEWAKHEAKPSRAEIIEDLRRIRALSPPLPEGAPLAEDLIREDRDSR